MAVTEIPDDAMALALNDLAAALQRTGVGLVFAPELLLEAARRLEARGELLRATKAAGTSYEPGREPCWCNGQITLHQGHAQRCLDVRAAVARAEGREG